jgi:SAM-dependent methyltransferase
MKYGKEYYDFCKKENGFDMNDCGGWYQDYFKFLKRVFGFILSKPNTISLDLGCATGAYLEVFRLNHHVMFGCDVSQWYIDNTPFDKIKYKMRVIENDKIPFSDNTFDFIHCCQVVEHIPEENLKTELKSMFNVLKKDGIVYISTVGEGPAVPAEGEDPTHISCFSKEKWERLFEEAGFVNITDQYDTKIKSDEFAGQYDWVNFILTKK